MQKYDPYQQNHCHAINSLELNKFVFTRKTLTKFGGSAPHVVRVVVKLADASFITLRSPTSLIMVSNNLSFWQLLFFNLHIIFPSNSLKKIKVSLKLSHQKPLIFPLTTIFISMK